MPLQHVGRNQKGNRMMNLKAIVCILLLCFITAVSTTQDNEFERIEFVLGQWAGTGTGFGNSTSVIESHFISIMDGRYIEVKNDSKFEPTENNPEGENHVDWGIISYDKSRKKIVYRQFNNEGYVNQYVLNDSLSDDSTAVFETEKIENFVDGGKARLTIKKKSQNEIETIFDVSFPGREFACFGTNKLKRK